MASILQIRHADPPAFCCMDLILPWSETFALGHEALDAEHRHLVDLANAIGLVVLAKNPAELADLVLPKLLHRMAAEHIRHENAILHGQAGTAFDEHVVDQTRLLERLGAITGGPVETICDGLKSWLIDYFYRYEADLKTRFQDSGVVCEHAALPENSGVQVSPPCRKQFGIR